MLFEELFYFHIIQVAFYVEFEEKYEFQLDHIQFSKMICC